VSAGLRASKSGGANRHPCRFADGTGRPVLRSKPDDHEYLFAAVAQAELEGRVTTLRWIDDNNPEVQCEIRFTHNLPLNESNADVRVNFLEYTKYGPGGDIRKRFSWVTDLTITQDNAWHPPSASIENAHRGMKGDMSGMVFGASCPLRAVDSGTRYRLSGRRTTGARSCVALGWIPARWEEAGLPDFEVQLTVPLAGSKMTMDTRQECDQRLGRQLRGIRRHKHCQRRS